MQQQRARTSKLQFFSSGDTYFRGSTILGALAPRTKCVHYGKARNPFGLRGIRTCENCKFNTSGKLGLSLW